MLGLGLGGWVLRDVARHWSQVQVGIWPRDCEVYQFPVGVAYLSGGTRPAVHACGQWACLWTRCIGEILDACLMPNHDPDFLDLL